MIGWPELSERAEAVVLLSRLAWWLRAAVVGALAAIILSKSGAPTAGIVELAIGAAALAAWWISPRFPGSWPARTLLICQMCLAGVGGFAAPSHHQTTLIALALMGMLSAGSDLPLGGVLAVFLVGVLGVEIGAVTYQHTDLSSVVGYPAILAAVALGGRYRRAYRAQAEQAQALLAESRRAQRESERVAALTERSRIAREIHDVLAHSLGALGIQIQAAEAMLSERQDVPSALHALARAQRLVDEGLTETRRAVHALRTDAPPLPEALAALVSDSAGGLTVTGEPYALSPAAGLALLRVAQEAVANARKHSTGRPAALTLSYAETGVELRVENELPHGPNGALPQAAGGYGLAGMHERLRLIHGELTAGPAGDRWVVSARVAR